MLPQTMQSCRAHDDDVVEEVIDQIESDGGDPSELEGQLLFGAGLVGLQHQHGVLVAFEPAVDQTGEGAESVEHAPIPPIDAVSHVSLGRIGDVDIDAHLRVRHAVTHSAPVLFRVLS